MGARDVHAGRRGHERRLLDLTASLVVSGKGKAMKLELATTTRSRLRGLLGRPGFDGVLMLVPCRDVHTFGMSRPLDIAFIAADGTVIDVHRGVGPRRRLKNRAAAATLERFADDGPWFSPGNQLFERM